MRCPPIERKPQTADSRDFALTNLFGQRLAQRNRIFSYIERIGDVMCGIVGYTGYQNARNIVLDGLKTLEYRGYDSAGIALGGERLEVFKCGGRVSALEGITPQTATNTALGHTRWATHGQAVAKNAHPHLSSDGALAIVHNGIIENCAELKAELIGKGIIFQSDTDSEIIAHLLSLEKGDMLGAIKRVADKIEGAATFLVMRKGDDAIYCHRRGASLAIGHGERENFVASDTVALCGHTTDITVMEDGEIAVLTPSKAEIYRNGIKTVKKRMRIERKISSDCKCYMRSEIDEIPAALIRTYESFLDSVSDDVIANLKNKNKLYIVGCGTAYHAGLYGKEIIEATASKPVEVLAASEFDKARFLGRDSAVILISQSGETADTLAALETSRKKGAYTFAVTNVEGSTITFGADFSLLLNAGAEVAVAATKSYNCQLLALYLLAHKLAGRSVPYKTIKTLADKCEDVASANLYSEDIKNCNLFFVGKGEDGITAKEGALKFKEITYKMTDAYPAGELKHGTIALIDKNSIVLFIATNCLDKHRIQITVSEIRARGAHTVALSAVGDIGADKTFSLPSIDDDGLYPLLAVIPLQTLALTTSLCLNLNPDKPRNLAKSVTVI